jgi:hypothetical protein
MTDEFKERIFQGARRMVIWGEPRADVLHRLEVNGIPAEEAQQMYERALTERVSILRTQAVKQVVQGLGLLIAAFFFFNRVADGTIGISRGGISAVLLTGCLGAWRFFKGLFGCLLARSREGSLTDHDDDDDVEE